MGTGDRTARGDEIVRLVRENFYDAKAAERWAQRHRGYGSAARSEEEFATLTRAALRELRASHTGYYTRRDPEFADILGIYGSFLNAGDGERDSIGVDVDESHFVRRVFAGSPLAASGLRRGDRLLKADGLAFDPVGSFEGKSGSVVTLTVQRKPHGESFEVSVRPRRIAPKQEWLEAQERGVRLVRRGGRTIAYVPMFSGAGEEFQTSLQELFDTRLSAADALVLDFRLGWGGCSPSFVDLFNTSPPILVTTDRTGKMSTLNGHWRKPLVLLIDCGSRSGKEAVAYAIKRRGLGTLVGERTAGAVLAGRCFKLPDGSLMMLAVQDVRVDGVRLERVGVEPDVAVVSALHYANGSDPQLDKAIELLNHRLRGLH